MTSKQIRQQFLDFFASKDHAVVDSSPVVPLDDPTLMFTNAGMNQFKDVFLGTGSRSYKRVADTQKCIRAGGKHNDLDDVGQDTYHHTFFEMLGNWSFGDYFKKEAIEWAWELLTGVWGIEKDRLHATYFEGDKADGLEPDTEAEELWRSATDIKPENVHPGSKKDNFWEMGETGPCGPCSEMHIDLTPDKSGRSLVNAGDPRVIELWNLVFIQFNRASDGKLTPLPAKHVDTGMGFERLAAVLQGMAAGRLDATSNYDTDVFTPIFEAIEKRTGAPAYCGTLPQRDKGTKGQRNEGGDDLGPSVPSSPRPSNQQQVMVDVSYRVIADHVRCLTFALTDGAVPGNEGRGYVLRRILRRAVRYGRQYLNMHEPFICDLVKPVVDHMGDAFPELRTAHGGKNVERLIELIRDEEASFVKTIDRALARFLDAVLYAVRTEIARNKGWTWRQSSAREAFFIEDDDDPGPTGERWRLYFEDPGAQPQIIELDMANLAGVRHLFGRSPVISGEDAFKLHDTYGFPIDLTELMAEEQGLTVNFGEYERLMEEARERARRADDLGERSALLDAIRSSPGLTSGVRRPTQFLGYDGLDAEAYVLAVYTDYGWGVSIREGQFGVVFLDATPFYAEKGGQAADTGIIRSENGRFEVSDVQELAGRVLHIGTCVEGELFERSRVSIGGAAEGKAPPPPLVQQVSRVHAEVSHGPRKSTMQNHTSTHMLNWALREVLGGHIQQKGSLVDPEKTRFDFSHSKAMTVEEIARVESLVNEMIGNDLTVHTAVVAQKLALEIETLRAVFGEKYPDRVRVVSVGAPIGEEDTDDPNTLLGTPKDPRWMKHPVEFCGGTHLKRSSEAERFVLISEEAVAKGIRRVVGISGEAARRAEEAGQALLAEARALADKPPVAPDADKPPVAPDADKPPGAPGAAAGTEGRRDEGTKPVGSAMRTRDGGDATGPSDGGEPPHPPLGKGGRGVGSAVRTTDVEGGPASEGAPGPGPYRDREGAGPSDGAPDAGPHGGPYDPSRGLQPARTPDDLAAALSAFQQQVNEATIPVRARHQLREIMAELQTKAKEQQKQAASASGDAVMDCVSSLLQTAEAVGGVKIVVGQVPSAPVDRLRGAIDWVRNKTEASAVLLGMTTDDKVTLVAGMSKAAVKKGLRAGDLIKEIAPLVGGRGGGRPDMAQGGGNDPGAVPKALNRADAWIRETLT